MAESDVLLTSRQAAQVLGLNINTIRKWADNGKLPSDRSGKGSHRRFKLGDLRDMAAQLEAERA